MTTKTAKAGTDENGLGWEDVEVFGKTYRLREITIRESDAAYDAAQNPDKTFNNRLNTRMQLAASMVDPVATVDDMEAWGVKKFVILMGAFDRLNSLPAADSEGNG